MFVFLELLDHLLDFVHAYCILGLDCRKKYSGYSVVHVYKFSHNFSNRLMVLKMILRLGFVDLVDQNCEFHFSTTRGTLGVKRTFW